MNNKELFVDVIQALRDLGHNTATASVRARHLLNICETEEQVLKHLNQEHQVRGIV
jgi:hypothetical protein